MTADLRVTRALTAAAKGSVVTGTLAGLVLASPLGAAAAADGPAIVVNRETVQVELKSSGALDTARLFSQLVINGDGKATILDPTSGKNIRDLDGFSPPDVKNGVAKYVVDVRGRTTRRTVSDFTGKLPLTVQVEYFLDGVKKKASDLVGKSGILDVKYTIENVSATPTPISYTVAGKKTTKTIDLVTPMVGQLSMTLPSTFTDIDTPRADVAGDGRGGQLLNWTMVLFEPIGQVKQEFGYTARVKDLQLPAAKIQVVPVSPNRHPELAFGEKGFYDGAASGGNVAFAGQTIDTNLAKLRDGAGSLLDGLTQLAAGAAALKDGLAGEAAPGAQKLADGLSAASAGSEKLLAGSQDLADGAGLAAAGATSLSAGLAKISAGLAQLGSTAGLPAALDGATALRAGVDKLLAGLGSATEPATILGGLAGLGAGLPQAKGGVDQIATALNAASATGGSLDQLRAVALGLAPAVNALAPGSCVAGPAPTPFPPPPVPPTTPCQAVATLYYGIGQVKTQSAQAGGGLGQVSAGLGTAISGVGALTAGVTQVKLGLKSGSTAKPGLAEGLDALVAGLTTAVAGVTQLSAGAKAASEGSVALADGTAKVAAGAGQLSKTGAAPLADGLTQLYSGGKQLADGLGAAADGSGQIADGLQKAKAGNVQVKDGAEALRTQAAVPLATAGLTTATQYAEHFAIMTALDEKAADGALPYGAPAGATGTAAYDFVLAGATSTSQDNTTRGIAAIALLALASASGMFVRRRVLSQ